MNRDSLDSLLSRKIKELPPTRGKGVQKCVFLAVWKKVKRAMDNGYTIQLIWETLREKGTINFQYSWFLKLIHRQLAKESTSHAGADRHAAPVRQPVKIAGDSSIPMDVVKRVVSYGEAVRELSPNFGKARDDLTLDDIFGFTGKNPLDKLK